MGSQPSLTCSSRSTLDRSLFTSSFTSLSTPGEIQVLSQGGPARTPHPRLASYPDGVASQPLPQVWDTALETVQVPAVVASPSPHPGPQVSTRAGPEVWEVALSAQHTLGYDWADPAPLPPAPWCRVPAMLRASPPRSVPRSRCQAADGALLLTVRV